MEAPRDWVLDVGLPPGEQEAIQELQATMSAFDTVSEFWLQGTHELQATILAVSVAVLAWGWSWTGLIQPYKQQSGGLCRLQVAGDNVLDLLCARGGQQVVQVLLCMLRRLMRNFLKSASHRVSSTAGCA